MRLEPALLALLLCAAPVPPATAQQVRILVQSSPLAGFQYYGGKILWDEMHEGDALTLVREPDNPHDRFAVRVEWRGQKLGYLPRADNRAVAEEMDRGTAIGGRIGKLAKDPKDRKSVV